MPESFGARLRQQREQQNIALASIAEQTKIKASLLEGLERDDVSHWPSGIFRRAYLRAYAQAIGLNPDAVVREFLERHPDPAEDLAAVAEAALKEGARGGPPTRLSYVFGSALASLSRRRRTAEPPVSILAGSTTPEPLVTEIPELADAVAITPSDDMTLAVPTVGTILAREHRAAEPPQHSPEAAQVPPLARDSEADLPGVDFDAVAQLCTMLGRADSAEEVHGLLADVAQICDAPGVIVWLWDAAGEKLAPALVHGYSEQVIAHLPAVRFEDDNATAAAFRTCEPCAIEGRGSVNGALALPLLVPGGCAGVLALELPQGGERAPAVRAAAAIFAAFLAQLVAGAAASGAEELPAAVPANPSPVLRVNARAGSYEGHHRRMAAR